jgi:dolichyl-phosphate-mannose--protein O-mannosyl transferase
MFTANANIKKSHAFGSGWRMWPLASKPVFYWTLNTPHFSRLRWCRIYMAANPLVWYVGLFLMTSDDL